MKKLIIVTVILFLISCRDNSNINIILDKTIIVYMAADNNLEPYAYNSINQMEKALPNNNLNVLVYLDTPGNQPRLFRIQKDNTNNIKSKIVKLYNKQDSTNPNIFNTVIKNIMEVYPAKSSGLILWSHATAWLPSQTQRIPTRSFGNDEDREMNINDLAKAIPYGFDYIIFDGCLMGSIEVAYELKDKVPYILASPMEILAEGMPYQRVLPIFFKDINTEERLKTISEYFLNYYNEKEEAGYKTAAIALIKTSELEKLARETKKIIESYPIKKWKYNYSKIQKLDAYTPTILFDYLDFFEETYGYATVESIRKQLRKTILYKANTEFFLDKYPINRFCGLSCYVPRKGNSYNTYYKTLNWTRDSGFDFLMK